MKITPAMVKAVHKADALTAKKKADAIEAEGNKYGWHIFCRRGTTLYLDHPANRCPFRAEEKNRGR